MKTGLEVPVAQDDGERLRVVITGGSAGIGAAMVRAFADAGHHVLFSYLRSVDAARRLTQAHARTAMCRLDQGDCLSVHAFSNEVREWAGARGVDVLVNNAALGSATVQRYVRCSPTSMLSRRRVGDATAAERDDRNDRKERREHKESEGSSVSCGEGVATSSSASGEESDEEVPEFLLRAAEDEALIRVNSLGPLWVTEALMPLVRKAAQNARARATVIFIGSVGGGSAAVFPEYRPSDLMGKAAMTYLSKHLAAEHMKDSVDVMCVSPGATETDMFRESTLSKVRDVSQFIDGMPKRRLIQPEDIAETVKWLATAPAARVFHGAVLDASLGLAVRPGLQTELAR